MSENMDRSRDSSNIPIVNNGSYALTGKIMFSAIVILFFVVILMFTLHLYSRWYLLHARHRYSRNARRNSRRTQVFYVDQNANAASVATRDLDARVLKLLPVFTFSSKTHPDSALECAVCLSEFEENESGCVLPKCNHSFHLECIDTWFHSQSTCPLCRAPVEESVPVSENPGDSVLTINEPSGGELGLNQNSESCTTCQHEEGQAGTSALGSGGKLSTEVSRRNIEGFEGESTGCESGPSQSYKSPMSRMLSFKRILSRDRRGNGLSSCPSPINVGSCGSITMSEPDIERGGDETRQTQPNSGGDSVIQ